MSESEDDGCGLGHEDSLSSTGSRAAAPGPLDVSKVFGVWRIQRLITPTV